ncbi:MAG: hypothetical protein V3R15_02645 [Qipengyuania citrea]
MDAGLIGVIVGGVIAIVGTIATPIVQHFLGKSEREAASRKENVQTLIQAVYELDDWLERHKQVTMMGKEVPLGPSPQAKLEALVLVHFPDAKLEFRQLSTAIAKHAIWSTTRGAERLSGKPVDLANFSEIIREFSVAKSNLIAVVAGEQRMFWNDETGDYDFIPEGAISKTTSRPVRN